MTGAVYPCALLTPSRAPGAAEFNAPLLGSHTLGIEVTEPDLAAGCGRGNIDPQHSPGGDGRAAIEAAMRWPLPPAGTRLVTIRADADALGAMAVLRLRATHGRLPSAAILRVLHLAACDAFDLGCWECWRMRRGPMPRPAAVADVAHLSMRHAQATAIATDPGHSLDQRVDRMAGWLQTGVFPADAAASAVTYLSRLAAAWNDGRIRVDVDLDGTLATVRAEAPSGLALGYRFAPVVIGDAGDRIPRRVTIAQFERGHANLRAVARALGALEPGWGGSDIIVGAPQGIGSSLPAETIRRIVSLNLTAASKPCRASQ